MRLFDCSCKIPTPHFHLSGEASLCESGGNPKAIAQVRMRHSVMETVTRRVRLVPGQNLVVDFNTSD